jgi:hypothetical protein
MHPGDPRRSRRWTALAIVLALALAGVVSGCGGGSTGNGTTAPTASAPDATAPPADATQPGTAPAAREEPPVTDELPSGGGGAQNARVPARFVVGYHHMRPRTITVPPMLAVQVSVRSDDGNQHRFVLETPEPRQLDVFPEQRAASMRVPGLRAGRYRIRVDYEPFGALVVGGEAGP